ncbi:MAG TPA: class I SAM-dependent methyltransferase [Nocardioidaceae bacterium]|nr:class I SAM-dependent methyltransferase [Nocardioidaceae bacterium]
MSTTKTKYDGLLSPYLRNRRLAVARPHLRGRVLDVGCAEGHLAASVAPADYVGVDLDEAILVEARAAHPEHVFVGVDELDPAERFDSVAALAVIEHVPDPGAWVRRWADHLVAGGRFAVTTPYDRYEPVHGLAARLRLTSDEAHDEHETTFDRESLEAVFEQAGLKLTTYRRFLLGLNQVAVAVR